MRLQSEEHTGARLHAVHRQYAEDTIEQEPRLYCGVQMLVSIAIEDIMRTAAFGDDADAAACRALIYDVPAPGTRHRVTFAALCEFLNVRPELLVELLDNDAVVGRHARRLMAKAQA